jgi:[ribosomal protein S18]-alanine N-acetyltransferase
MVTLSPLQSMDAPLLAPLHQSAFGAHAWTAPMLAESLASGWGLGLWLPRAGTSVLIGFALCQQLAEECEILTLAIAAPEQRRGYGRALLQALYDAAKTSGTTRLLLEVAADNLAAAQLYTSFGFHQTGVRPAYYPRPTGAVAARLLQVEMPLYSP